MTYGIVNSVNEYLDVVLKLTKCQEEIKHNEHIKFYNLSHEVSSQKNSENLIDYYKKIAIDKNYFDETLDSKQIVFNYFEKESSNNYKFYYRGHYRNDYKLIPSVFRDTNWYKEDWFYHEIMVRCPEHFQYTTHLDKLVTMQHYECPTRLLDVTSNPLVALYFACKNFSCSKCNESKEGEVIIFPVQEREILYSDSDRALMLSCISRFSAEDKNHLYIEAQRSLFDGKFKQKRGGSTYEDITVERFFHEITTELPSFKREIKPIDILKPLFVQPNKTNGRILKQDGAFIVSGLSENAKEAEAKLKAIEYSRILIREKEQILNELSLLGINEATLFPEVDKVSHFLIES